MRATDILLLNVASTWYMVGLIWIVQLVHYPLFAGVGSESFPAYERQHTAGMAWVVGPPMLIELATTVLLLQLRPEGITGWSVWLGAVLLAAIWLSTALIQVPCHQSLSQQFDAAVHARLVTSNWLRTAAWSARGLLTLWMLRGLLESVQSKIPST